MFSEKLDWWKEVNFLLPFAFQNPPVVNYCWIIFYLEGFV
ncbi:hypothetical protein C943_00349 [Mariniradius saccharolyticus AK6]|uniref:Uncharacterized protein n=1 Tax=Mariniradius saccharolyticus AK6 TaxID=1239962 RepID=M7XX36_9BACT|nr:hypothetical protein C943_00349 [Mariniradius saccharolyticus AK6]